MDKGKGGHGRLVAPTAVSRRTDVTAVTRIAAIVTLASVPLMLWGTFGMLADFHDSLFDEKESGSLSPPKLKASAGDGDARLTWSVPSDELRLVEQWEYEQFDSRGETVAGYGTGSSATSYLVVGLTNGETYSFRVRAILKVGTGKVRSWSNTVSVVPMQGGGDVLERMERHQHGMERHQWSMARQQEEMAREQGRIADSASAVAAFMTEDRKAFRRLADRGIRALETLAGSSRDICGGRGIAKETSLYFENKSFNVDHDGNLENIQSFADNLNEQEGKLVLTVGYATAIGEDAYNLQLSDRRAACASLCIRERLGDRSENFEFREVAKGETVMSQDLPGTSPDSRRVDVILCGGDESADSEAKHSGEVSDLRADDCGCETMSSGESEAEDEA